MKKRKTAEQRPDDPPWSVPVPIADIPETGRRIDLAADEATRAALAKTLNIVALPRLDAALELTRHGREGVRVTGVVSAVVGQNCVVTLQPMESRVEEPLDLVFVPAGQAKRTVAGDTGEDPPEVLTGSTLDLGALAAEFLALGIDPYPRLPDASFEPLVEGDPTSHPFAALAALKKDMGGKDH
jgi:uncharacterized metal-binding protein YceD (DUF177 family)